VVAAFRLTLRSLIERYGDIGLAAVMAAAAIAEAVGNRGSPRPGHAPLLTLLFTVPLVWRRCWPMAVMLAVFVGIVVANQAAYVEVACTGIAAYAVGAHARQRLPGLFELVLIGALAAAVINGRLPTLPGYLGPIAVLLPLWLVGNAIRGGRARTDELAERASRLENEQRLSLKAAQADERARIARELHDVVAHSVSVMVVQAGAARQVVRETPERATESLRAVEDTGKAAMQELRRILDVFGDDNTKLEPQPDLTQVPALVGSVRDAGLPVQLEITGAQRPLTPMLELAAYRIIQEALTNAVKHSGLAATRVAIDYQPTELKLEILCDGPVPPPANGGSPGRGVAGMTERVSLVGGRIEAGPGPERGYHVRAWLPAEATP
jgi:signal transduction histidine kinase